MSKISVLQKLSIQQFGWMLEGIVRLLSAQRDLRSDWPSVVSELQARKPKNLGSVERADFTGDSELDTAERMAESVRVAARLLPSHPACLPRSLVLYRMLRARGIRSDLMIGVTKGEVPRTLSSHAWVEIASRAVAEPTEPSKNFQVIPLQEMRQHGLL